MFQRKEQDKILEKERKKIEVNNLPEKGLTVMVIKMLTKVGRRMNSENFSKETEHIIKYQSEVNTLNEMKKYMN